MAGPSRIPEPSVVMNVNKVVYDGETLIDLTSDTVIASDVRAGVSFHLSSGYKMNGTLEVPEKEERSIELSMTSGNQVINANEGKVMSKVTVVKPSTMISDNIKKDVNIGGVVGTYKGDSSAGGGSETWVLNYKYIDTGVTSFSCNFSSNGSDFTSISIETMAFIGSVLKYDNTQVCRIEIGDTQSFGWSDGPAYRKLTFFTEPTGELLIWLEVNAVKQASDTAVQESKSVSITENGTTTVSPDVPYDAVASVEITANVASSGGGEAVWYDPV